MALPLEDPRDNVSVWTGSVARTVHTFLADRPRLVGRPVVGRRNLNKEDIMPDDSNEPQRIQPGVTTVFCAPDAPTRKLRLALYHVPADKVQRLLRVWELEAMPEGNGFHELVDEIDHEASEDAAQLGFSAQRYVLQAHIVGRQDIGSLSLRYASSKLDISWPRA